MWLCYLLLLRKELGRSAKNMKFAALLRRWKVWQSGLLLVAYVAMSYSISMYATDSSYVSLFWPCSGLAIGVLLLGGYRYAPLIFAGEIIGNALSGFPLWVSGGIGLINASEYSLTCLALRRQKQFDPALTAHSDFLRLILTGAAIGLVSAACSSLLLLQTGLLTADTLVSGGLRWWQGDVMGIILITPMVLVWKSWPAGWFSPLRRTETLAMITLTVLAGQVVLHGWLGSLFAEYARAFMLFPALTWAATRYGRHGLTLVILIVMLQALAGGMLDVGYFATDIKVTGGQNMWLFLIIFSLVGITLVLSVERLQQTQVILRQSRLRLVELMLQSNRVREEERKHIASEIHDEIGQILTAIKLESMALKRRMPDEPSRAELDHLAGLADRSIKVVRNIATALRPPALDLGLLPGIRVLVEGFERNTGVSCEVSAECAADDIPSYIAVAAYRVVQESLTNIARHAGASKVVIELRCDAGKMVVSIRDDGCGLEDASQRAGYAGFGLRGMSERVETVGGKFKLDTSPGRGTLIEIELPLKME